MSLLRRGLGWPAHRFSRGDWVEVRSAREILATLDARGRLEGLPFMPEMALYCGRRLRVRRRADKTCVEGHGLRRLKRVVLLAEARCDGAAHDGCQRNCLMFWKEAWLKPADGPGGATVWPGIGALLARIPTRHEDRYLCQSTALAGATSNLSKWNLAHLVTDLLRGDLDLHGFLDISARTLINLARRRAGLPELGMLAGEGDARRPPALALKSGERVRVRSLQAIRATLGAHGKAGGLSFEPEMGRYAGGCFEVDFPVRRIIHEETGRMVELKDTVALKGLACQGSCVKNCPRANTLYWREAWLDRTDPAPPSRERRRAARTADKPRPAVRARRPSRRSSAKGLKRRRIQPQVVVQGQNPCAILVSGRRFRPSPGDFIMRGSWIGGAVAACVLGMAGWANAATVLATYSGLDFLNRPFTATFELDTNQGIRFDGPGLSEVRGSGQATFTGPNGSFSLPAGSLIELIYQTGKTARASAHYVNVTSTGYSWVDMAMTFYSPLVPNSVDKAFSTSGSGWGTGYSEIVDRPTHSFCCGGLGGTLDSIDVTSISSPPRIGGILATPFEPSVPEPATWSMLILGLSTLGGALRKRRRRMI